MRSLITAVGLMALAAGLASAQGQNNALTRKESADGWMLLFDGKSLNGWEPHVGGDWIVEDGALVCPGTTAEDSAWILSDTSPEVLIWGVTSRMTPTSLYLNPLVCPPTWLT